MPEYEDISLEQALAHLRDGTGKVEGKLTDWAPLRKHGDSLEHLADDWYEVEDLFGWSFRLVKEEPEIVKPVKCETSRDLKGVSQIYAPEGDYIWTGRPRAQQERLGALVEAFVARCENCFGTDPRIRDFADFLRAEKEAK